MRNCPKKYQGQALAISMIVLVVCAILGISMYSRVVKDRRLVLNEKISTEALEIADSLLDSLSTISVATLREQIDEEEGFMEVKGWSDVNTFLDSLGLSNSIQNLDVCQQGNSSVNILIEEGTIEDSVEIRPNEARAFRIEGKSVSSSCSLGVYLKPEGTVSSGVIVKKIYGQNYLDTPDYKIYEEDDIEAYCFSEDGFDCNSSNFSPNANWIKIDDGGDTLDIDLTETKSGYSLDEIRIIPIGGVVGISAGISPDDCMPSEDLGTIRIVANVTCQDIYRAKEVFVPDDGVGSFSSLFDYTVYNNIGLLDL